MAFSLCLSRKRQCIFKAVYLFGGFGKVQKCKTIDRQRETALCQSPYLKSGLDTAGLSSTGSSSNCSPQLWHLTIAFSLCQSRKMVVRGLREGLAKPFSSTGNGFCILLEGSRTSDASVWLFLDRQGGKTLADLCFGLSGIAFPSTGRVKRHSR